MAVDRRSSRLGTLAAIAVLLFGALGTRLWFLQGVQASTYQEKVDSAKTRTVSLPPERGRIYDAKGRILADNQRILTVTIDWTVIRKSKVRAQLFERLSGPLKIPVEDMEDRYSGKLVDGKRAGSQYDPLLPLPLKEDVDEQTVQFLLERREDYPGIGVLEQWKRVYPYAPLASHVIGYLGAINSSNLDQYLARGYNRNERVGAFGVEQSMEDQLHGTWGTQEWEIDAAGNTVRLLSSQAPVAGKDIQLSIDLDVQQFAEQALQTELRNRATAPTEQQAHNGLDPKTNLPFYPAFPEYVPYKAPAGSVVVLDHSTGAVIAMASYPTFDNRWFSAGISKAKFDQIFPPSKDPDQSILVNRAVSGQYNLGSTIKPFVAWSAMHSGILSPDYIFSDRGTYTLESINADVCASGVKCVFKNAVGPFGKPSQYGDIKLPDALAVSSDSYFYRLGELFYNYPGNRDALKTDLEQFGFGTPSGIDLPFEWSGRIPDDQIKKDLKAKGVLAKGEADHLVTGDIVQVAIGQGLMAATPLQLADAYATIANNGFLLRPHIVQNIYDPLVPDSAPAVADLTKGTIDRSYEAPETRQQLEMPLRFRDPIIEGLGRVIEGPGTYYPDNFLHRSTGELLYQTYPYQALPIAGKTGTAQGAGNYPWNDSSAFGAFSLDDTKPYTVVAYLEKSGYGAKAAAPVVKCMFTMLAGKIASDPVVPSDPLDLRSPVAAPPLQLRDPSCLIGNDNPAVKD
jgi:penicillin-binding protein 2